MCLFLTVVRDKWDMMLLYNHACIYVFYLSNPCYIASMLGEYIAENELCYKETQMNDALL